MLNRNTSLVLLVITLVFLSANSIFAENSSEVIKIIPKNNNELYSPVGVAVSGNKIYVTNTLVGKIQIYDKNNGKLLSEFGERGMGKGKFSLPWDVAIGKNKNIYVSDLGQHRILIFNRNGK